MRCLYCGKKYKHYHSCKYDPANRNCFSCRHLIGVNQTVITKRIIYPFTPDEPEIDMELKQSAKCYMMGNHPLDKGESWEMDCPGYEEAERVGKAAYYNRIRGHILYACKDAGTVYWN